MKAISASIITLAGAVVFSVGATINHSDTRAFVCVVGGALALIGLYVWATCLRGREIAGAKKKRWFDLAWPEVVVISVLIAVFSTLITALGTRY
jgi:low temperature requirement protein LtrA